MSEYEEQNRKLLDALQKNVHSETIHGVRMEVKDIPDPVEGTVLDPRVYENRKAAEERGNPWAECLELPVQQIREDAGYPNRDITSGTVLREERRIVTRNGETPVFLYCPQEVSRAQGASRPQEVSRVQDESPSSPGRAKKPALVFFHGGAFIAGSTRVVENFCRLLAEQADMLVVGVDYRLAPEHPFPAGLYDCYDAVDWVIRNAGELGVDAERIAVGGDSAGGTLAIGCCILERDAVAAGKLPKSRICYEALLYPGVLVDNFKLDDYKWRMADYGIPEEDMLAMGAAVSLKAMTAEMPQLYMGEEGHVKNPLAAPLCQESLSGLPRTLVVLCEFDYLRLSGEAFARKLERDGVPARTILYRGMDHAFIDKVGDYPQAYDAAVEIAADMRLFSL